jgi:HEPN domain-containing protein
MVNLMLPEQNQVSFLEDGSNFIEQVERLEKLLINSGSPDIYVGNSDALPLKHSFSNGIYVREIFIKKGMFAIGKIHKFEHTFFLMKGKMLLCTEDGVIQIEAPFYGNSSAGTKRVVIALEDVIFVNVHPNLDNTQNIEELEERYVVSSYEEFKEYKQLLKN